VAVPRHRGRGVAGGRRRAARRRRHPLPPQHRSRLTMCACVNVAIGTYANQVQLPRPPHMAGRREGTASDAICVDACLADEVRALWAEGIRTTGCCCGLYALPGDIGGVDEDVLRMRALRHHTHTLNMVLTNR